MTKYKYQLFTYTPEQSVVVFNPENEPEINDPNPASQYYASQLYEYNIWQSQSITLTMDDVEVEKVLEHLYNKYGTTVDELANYPNGYSVQCIDIVDMLSHNGRINFGKKAIFKNNLLDGKAVFKEPVGEGETESQNELWDKALNDIKWVTPSNYDKLLIHLKQKFTITRKI